jgi:transcriptional regulator with XRE-family HTH domain
MTDHAPRAGRTNDPAIGNRIARARADAGFKSAAAFALAINVHPSQLSRWESGDVPKVEALRLIAETTNVSIDWLVTGSERNAGHDPQAA